MDATDHSRLVALAESLADDHADMMAALVAIRREGLTQVEVAERMGITQPTVAALERYDANPTISTVRRYALAVGAMIRTTITKTALAAEHEGVSQETDHMWAEVQRWTTSETYARADGMGYAPVEHVQFTVHRSAESPVNILTTSWSSSARDNRSPVEVSA